MVKPSYKIAIIEDDPVISQMYRFKLEADGYEVATAIDGKNGLELAQSMLPDLILLDLMIPLLSGDKMLQQMRAQAWGKNIKVIVLTNISRADAPPILNGLNINRYVVKAQVTPSQIVETVKQVLGQK